MITLVATFCLNILCNEVIITDSNKDESLNWMSCQIEAQQGIAEWLRHSTEYASWRLAKWKCVPGKYELHDRS